MSRYAPRPWSAPVAGRPVVLGVEPGQSTDVVRAALEVARGLGTGLACVWVDPAHVVAGTADDGTVDLTPVDPDHDEEPDAPPPGAEVADRLAAVLDGTGVPWRFVYAAGETTRGLRAVADALDAAMIAVGTRRPGFGGWMDEVLGGSVAARLAHTQQRPVLVVPSHPHAPASARATEDGR